jgi:hypothetical protein
MINQVILTREEWNEFCRFIRYSIHGESDLMQLWMDFQNRVTTRLDEESTNAVERPL